MNSVNNRVDNLGIGGGKPVDNAAEMCKLRRFPVSFQRNLVLMGATWESGATDDQHGYVPVWVTGQTELLGF